MLPNTKKTIMIQKEVTTMKKLTNLTILFGLGLNVIVISTALLGTIVYSA